MVIGDNEQQVRQLIDESVNLNRPDMLKLTVDRDVRLHPGTPGANPDTVGIDELEVAFGRFHDAFPDLHIDVDDTIASGDRVAVRWTATGTHRGDLAGISPTGRAVRWGGIDVYRLREGMVVEWWRNDDFVGLLQQLGRDPFAPAGG